MFLLLVVCAAGQAMSQSSASATADANMLLTLKRLYPATQIKQINPTPVPGIFEVVMSQNVAYIDASGRYFFVGRLLDMQTQTDLTAARAEQATQVDAGSLPLGDAIKVVKGNGSRKLIVFSDPDCPHCRQLERNLAALTDVTIYTFIYPILNPSSSKPKAAAVWCATDPVSAWTNLLATGQTPVNQRPGCQPPTERNVALGERLGITGTPTLISGDGRKSPGAASADRISQWLDAARTASVSQ